MQRTAGHGLYTWLPLQSRARRCAVEGSIGTDLHKRVDASLATRYRRGLNFAPTDPPFGDALAGQPARAGPDSLGVAPYVMGSARPAHRPAAHRVAALPAEFCDLGVPSRGPDRCQGPALPGQSDSEDLDAPDCGPCWPEPVTGGRPDPDQVTRMRLRERGRRRIRRSHPCDDPTTKCIWPIGPPLENTPTLWM